MSTSDTFICGSCQSVFHDINLFVQHKMATDCCRGDELKMLSSENSSQFPLTDTPSTGTMTYFVIQNVASDDDDNGACRELTSALQSVVDISDMNCLEQDINQSLFDQGTSQCTYLHGTIISEPSSSTKDTLTANAGDLEIVPLNGTDDIDGSNEGHSIDLQVFVRPTRPNFNHSSLSSNHKTSSNVATPLFVIARRGRGRGRPRKLEEKTSLPTTRVVQSTILPEKGPDGRYKCLRCEKNFLRERHYKSHRCLETTHPLESEARRASDENDVKTRRARAKNEMTQTVLMQEEAVNQTNKKTQKIENKTMKDLIKIIVTSSESESKTVEEEVSSCPMSYEKSQSKTTANSDECHQKKSSDDELPVFCDENDRLRFDQSLNVDLGSLVDHLVKRYSIEQEENERTFQSRNSRMKKTLDVFSCQICSKVFMSLSHVRLHCVTHSQLRPFKCFKCKYETNTKGNLYTHMRSHTGMIYRCDSCNFTSVNRGHLKEHEETHLNVKEKCEICRRDYNTRKSLINHIRKYHKTHEGMQYRATFQKISSKRLSILHECRTCQRKFKKKVDLDRHLFCHDVSLGPSVCRCQVCDYVTSRKIYLERHVSRHRIVYVCCVCSAKFASCFRLRCHLTQSHDIDEVKSNFETSIERSMFLPEKDGSMEGWTEEMTEENGSGGGGGDRNCEIVEFNQNDVDEDDVKIDLLSRSNDDFERMVKSEEPLSIFQPMNSEEPVEDDYEKRSGDIDDISTSSDDLSRRWNITITNDDERNVDFEENRKKDEEFKKINNSRLEIEIKDREIKTSDDDIFIRLGFQAMNQKIFEKIKNAFGNEECEFCGRLFLSKLEMKNHMKVHSGDKPFSCDQCSYRSLSKENLQNHVEKEHDKATYVCYICGLISKSKSSFWLHNRKKHSTQPEEYICTKCNIQFSSIKRLRIHLQIKHSELDKNEIREIVLSFKRQRSKFGQRIHRCPYCDKAFTSSFLNLQKHIWMHEGIKPYKCSLCSYSSSNQSNLNAHMIRHSSEKPFLCTECGKSYKSRTALRWHIRNHKSGLLFKCNRCPYKAIQPSHLRRHLETHNVMKRFACQMCSYSANTETYLKIHQTRNHSHIQLLTSIVSIPPSLPPPSSQNHTLESSQNSSFSQHALQCLSCNFRFGNASDLKRHLKSNHHIEIEKTRNEIISFVEEDLKTTTTEIVLYEDKSQSVLNSIETNNEVSLTNDHLPLEYLDNNSLVTSNSVDDRNDSSINTRLQQNSFDNAQTIFVPLHQEENDDEEENQKIVILDQNGDQVILTMSSSGQIMKYNENQEFVVVTDSGLLLEGGGVGEGELKDDKGEVEEL